MDEVESFREQVAARSRDHRWAVAVVGHTGSTNADLVRRARAGECPAFTALIALEQGTGRGRLDRAWSTPRGTSIALSMATPLVGTPATWGLLPLATGVAVVRALGRLGVIAGLKWPNDVLIDGLKVCGILVEVAGSRAVAGAGINVGQTAATIGFPGAVSLAMAGCPATREVVAALVLDECGAVFDEVVQDPRGVVAAYRAVCTTVGQSVRVQLGDQTEVVGRADGVADDGQLLVDVDGEIRTFASGDVYHLR
ncbi:MAG: biotin--[acetyl-CoA-carboxylase] ligase [Propionibacteriaceae bacterium]|nr:biotin--[acetyl-CoA-carboxylase] ligase [Propionibacteriaceae bacterium]